MINGLGNMGNAGGGGSGGQAPDCKQQIIGCWDAVPAWNRVIFILCVGIYLLSFALPAILMILVCMPQAVVFKFQIWRLLTGVFCHTQLLELLFSVLSYIPTAMRVEKDMGTVRMMWRFLTLGVLINFIFTCIVVPLGINQLSVGLWPLLFADIVCDCMRDPDQARGLCCLPIRIQSKWYPLVLLVLFSLFFGPQISLFVGLLVGYLQVWGYTARIEMGVQTATRYESKWPFQNYKDKPYFVSTGASMGGSILPSQMPRSSDGNPVSSSPAAPANAFSAFSGKATSLAAAPSRSAQSQPQQQAPPAPAKSAAEQEADRKARIERFKQKHTNVDVEVGVPIEESGKTATNKASDNHGEYRIVDDTHDSLEDQ